VAVVGGGNSATEESLFLVKFVEKVTLLVRSGALRASQVIKEKAIAHPQIEIRFNTEVVRFSGSGGKLKAVEIRNNQTGSQETIHPAGVFVFIGLTPNTAIFERTAIQRNSWGFIVTGHDLSPANRNVPTSQPVGICGGRMTMAFACSLRALRITGWHWRRWRDSSRTTTSKLTGSKKRERPQEKLIPRKFLRRHFPAVGEEMTEVTKEISIPEEELRFTTSLSSGPGGQNVNKVNTRVTLWFDVANSPSLSPEQKDLIIARLGSRISKDGVLRVISQQARSQAANRELAIERFIALLRDAIKLVPPRKKTRVSRTAKLRRLEEKKQRSMLKSERSQKVTNED
jgi:ribosome-associated protein